MYKVLRISWLICTFRIGHAQGWRCLACVGGELLHHHLDGAAVGLLHYVDTLHR